VDGTKPRGFWDSAARNTAREWRADRKDPITFQLEWRPLMAKKKNSKKKSGAKKAAAKALPAPKITAASKARSKGEVYRTLAEQSGLKRADVVRVFDVMTVMMEKDLNSKVGTFNVPGLMRVKVVRKPATKARMGKNPFTGEMQQFAAKPARKVVRVRPLKALKDLVG
jgi:nucleoid DNA-binding protein